MMKTETVEYMMKEEVESGTTSGGILIGGEIGIENEEFIFKIFV